MIGVDVKRVRILDVECHSWNVWVYGVIYATSAGATTRLLLVTNRMDSGLTITIPSPPMQDICGCQAMLVA